MQDTEKTPERPVLKLKKKRIIINRPAKKPAAPTPAKKQKSPPPKAAPQPSPKKKKSHHQSTPEEAEQGRAKLSAYLNETSAAWRNFQPLAVGIRQASKPLMKELKLPRKRLAELLDQHCKDPEYLKNLIESSNNQRYRLDGTPEGAITPEQKARAKKQLQWINKNR